MSFIDYPRVHRRDRVSPMWESTRLREGGEECMCAASGSATLLPCALRSGIIASDRRAKGHRQRETLPHRESRYLDGGGAHSRPSPADTAAAAPRLLAPQGARP